MVDSDLGLHCLTNRLRKYLGRRIDALRVKAIINKVCVDFFFRVKQKQGRYIGLYFHLRSSETFRTKD